MREHEEDVRLRIGIHTATSGLGEVLNHHDGDLIGNHVTERPDRHLQQLAHSGVAVLEVEGEWHLSVAQRGQHGQSHDGNADGGPQPQGPTQARIGEHLHQLRLAAIHHVGHQQ